MSTMKESLMQLVANYLLFWAQLVLRGRRPRIVGITGSVGKTTTKEAVAAVLMHPRAKVFLGLVGKSVGNLNTEIGLPLAVLQIPAAPRDLVSWMVLLFMVPWRVVFLTYVFDYPAILVLEYAADRPGDIKQLVRVAPPEVAVVTAVGPAHLERFGTPAHIAKEKAALVRSVLPTGLVILARDNSLTSAMSRETQAPVTQVAGRGQALSLNIARAVADYFALPRELVQEALKDFTSLEGRLSVTHWVGGLLIDDTYNANPLSMELALDTLLEQAPSGTRRVAILGDMRELGEASEDYHQRIGRYARERADVVVAVGKYAALYDGDYWYPTSLEASLAIGTLVQTGDTILVKGSRGVTMERVVVALTNKHPKEQRGTH